MHNKSFAVTSKPKNRRGPKFPLHYANSPSLKHSTEIWHTAVAIVATAVVVVVWHGIRTGLLWILLVGVRGSSHEFYPQNKKSQSTLMKKWTGKRVGAREAVCFWYFFLLCILSLVIVCSFFAREEAWWSLIIIDSLLLSLTIIIGITVDDFTCLALPAYDGVGEFVARVNLLRLTLGSCAMDLAEVGYRLSAELPLMLFDTPIS